MLWRHASPDVAGCFFSNASTVNLSFPEWEGRREWPRGRPQLTSSHLLSQAAFAHTLVLYNVGLCTSGREWHHDRFRVSTVQGMYVPLIKLVTQQCYVMERSWSSTIVISYCEGVTYFLLSISMQTRQA